MVKNPPAKAEDMDSVPGSGRSPGGGNGTPLQYPCLGNPVDRGAWRATVSGVKESWIQLRRLGTHSARSSLLLAGFSLVAAIRGYSPVWGSGFMLRRLLLLVSRVSRVRGLRWWPCDMQDPPEPGIKPVAPALTSGFLTARATREAPKLPCLQGGADGQLAWEAPGLEALVGAQVISQFLLQEAPIFSRVILASWALPPGPTVFAQPCPAILTQLCPGRSPAHPL